MHHFATEHDVAEELFALLSEARVIYLQDVIKSGKRYDRYVTWTTSYTVTATSTATMLFAGTATR